MDTTMNEFQKAQEVRHLAKQIIGHLSSGEDEAAVDDIVTLAGAIKAQDMSGYATKADLKDAVYEIVKWVAGIITIQSGFILALKIFG